MSKEMKELVVNDRRHHVSADAEQTGDRTLMETLAAAVQRGLPVETLNALMDFQERIEAKEAKKTYIEAMAEARKTFLPLIKKHSGYLDRYKHEKLNDVCDAVDDALSANGLKYRWKTEDLDNGCVRVTCFMNHVGGHEESDSGSGDPKLAADPKANMNGFQRRETAISYLKRSTLKSICGIAAGEADDDAQNIKDEPDYDTSPWTERLLEADDMETLTKIGADIKKVVDMPDGARKSLQAAWSGKAKQIKSRMGANV